MVEKGNYDGNASLKEKNEAIKNIIVAMASFISQAYSIWATSQNERGYKPLKS